MKHHLSALALGIVGLGLMLAVELLERRYGPHAGYGRPWGRL